MNATTQTTKTPSKTDLIRAELKAAGIKRLDVSIRGDRNSIRCEIKSASVSYAVVKAAAYKHESIDRCERTGEILCGGNTYVGVYYSSEVVSSVAKQILPMLSTVKDCRFSWRGFSVSYDEAYNRFSVWYKAPDKDYSNHVSLAHNEQQIAETIALAALEHGIATL